jgi:hypothetical protein
MGVALEVVGTTDFEDWFLNLDSADRARVEDRVELLEQHGPTLGRPVVDSIKASRHHNMKELRTGTLRVLFVFDPTSSAVLLIGGNKRDQWTQWYETAIPVADDLFDSYLVETKQTAQDPKTRGHKT